MKRFYLAIALLATLALPVQAQQVKSTKAAKAAVEKAAADTLNPKKNTKPATWIKLGKSFLDAYAAPAGNAWVGATMADAQIVLGEEKPISEEVVELGGQQMTKAVYETRNYYYAANGVLQIIEVTQPIYPDALEQAMHAYVTAQSLDEKGSKKKDLALAFQTISGKFVEEAYNAYTFNNLEKASYYFGMAAEASLQEPYASVDTSSVYNAGLTAYMIGDIPRAKKYFEQSVALGYYGEDGDAYAKLADIADKSGDKALCRQYLEEAFMKFPQSQGVLIGLINYYINSGENTDRLFELISAAKANEPNNASLYYVEGNVNLQLGRAEDAIAAYEKCSEINPEYEFGYIGIGQYWYNKAVELQDLASAELDDKKYEALVAEFETSLKNCIEPFEKAFDITKDDGIKIAICEYLKNACYRFCYDKNYNEDPYYKAKYDKYNEIAKAAQAQ